MRPHSRSLSTFDLLGLALRDYRVELKERVTRYKQVLLVIALLALPGLPAFKAVVLAPLQQIFARNSAAGASAVGYVLVLALWAALQRGAVGSVAAAAIMNSLPLPRLQVLLRDALFLASVSTPWTVLLAVAAGTAPHPMNMVERGVAMLAVSAIALTVQLAILRARYAVAAIGVGAAVLACGDARPGARMLAATAIIAAVVWLGRCPPLPRDFRPRQAKRCAAGGLAAWRCTTLTALYWMGLYRGRHGAYRLTLALVAALGVFVGLLVAQSDGTPSRAVGLAAAYAALATGVLGLGFGTLTGHQRAYAGVLAPLPIARPVRVLQAIVAVEGPALLFVGVLLSLVAARSGLRYGALVAICALLLSAFQYVAYRAWPRHTIAAGLLFSISIVVATSWVASVWAR
ncbi:hypothetical protein KRM18_14815 [Xanthomonas hortorum pv. gardneri]|uniref:hypothetical protein n=1 Tax=Xanthomonas hortorum TaxID=56454 RepID=UPI003ED93B77